MSVSERRQRARHTSPRISTSAARLHFSIFRGTPANQSADTIPNRTLFQLKIGPVRGAQNDADSERAGGLVGRLAHNPRRRRAWLPPAPWRPAQRPQRGRGIDPETPRADPHQVRAIGSGRIPPIDASEILAWLTNANRIFPPAAGAAAANAPAAPAAPAAAAAAGLSSGERRRPRRTSS